MALRQQGRSVMATTLEMNSLRAMLLLLVLLIAQWLVLHHSVVHLFHDASESCQLFIQAEQPCGGVSPLDADLFPLATLALYLLPLSASLFSPVLTHSFSARAPPSLL